jgi:hypothetical protein
MSTPFVGSGFLNRVRTFDSCRGIPLAGLSWAIEEFTSGHRKGCPVLHVLLLDLRELRADRIPASFERADASMGCPRLTGCDHRFRSNGWATAERMTEAHETSAYGFIPYPARVEA